MNSLKAFIPLLSDALQLTPDVLYEKQRALVRAGLLKNSKGRGPGSGVRLTPDAVAMLLIAVLATDSLSEVEKAARLLAKAKRDSSSSDTKPETLGGAETFKAALINMLSSDEIAAEATVVRVHRGDGWACFFDGTPDGGTMADFFAGKKPSSTSFYVMAHINIGPIRALLRQAEGIATRTKPILKPKPKG